MSSRRRRRRRRGRWISPLAQVFLALGALVAVVGLCMPWIALDAGLLSTLGIIDSDPVVGFRIPSLVEESGHDPIIQGGLALNDLFSGRLDHMASRVLFGERYEEQWAPVVFVPTLFSLAALILLHFRSLRPCAPLLAAFGLLICAVAVWCLLQLLRDNADSGDLLILPGVWVNLAGLGLSSLGSILLTQAPARR